MESEKIYDNGDGTYTIALSVKGETSSSTTSQTTKANVILVLDTSSSMNGNAGNTYYTVVGTPGDPASEGNIKTTYYRQNGSGYSELTWRNNGWYYRDNNNRWTEYTGAFYARSRLWAEKHTLTDDNGVIDSLLSQNVATDQNKKDIIEIAVVDFNATGNAKLNFTTNATTLKNTINGLTTDSGTNWEEALMRADEYADAIKTTQPNEKVYVIFLTDGQPTAHNDNPGPNSNYDDEWSYAANDARGIIEDGNEL